MWVNDLAQRVWLGIEERVKPLLYTFTVLSIIFYLIHNVGINIIGMLPKWQKKN